MFRTTFNQNILMLSIGQWHNISTVHLTVVPQVKFRGKTRKSIKKIIRVSSSIDSLLLIAAKIKKICPINLWKQVLQKLKFTLCKQVNAQLYYVSYTNLSLIFQI